MIDEAGREASHELLLEDDQHEDQWDQRENGSSRENGEAAEFAAGQRFEADRDGTAVRLVRDQERPQILSPRSEKRNDGERADRRPDYGDDDVSECLEVAASVDLSGSDQFDGCGTECSGEEKNSERRGEEARRRGTVRSRPGSCRSNADA